MSVISDMEDQSSSCITNTSSDFSLKKIEEDFKKFEETKNNSIRHRTDIILLMNSEKFSWPEEDYREPNQ